MRKGKSVIGQPVYTVSDGRKLDSVKDLVLEEGEDGVVALLVSEGGLLSTSMVVPFGSVVRFGPSAVMIEDGSSVVPATSEPRVNEILGRQGTLLGSKVLTEGGEELGTIADFYFDEASGRVLGYEVSGGPLKDLGGGSSYLPFERIRTVGADAVVASEDALADLGPGGAAPGQGFGASGDDPRSGATEPGLLGARSRRDVLDRSGAVLVASGQVITPERLEQARAAGVTEDLYDAAGIQRPGVQPPDPGEALSKAADSAADLWGRFTTKISEMTDAAGQRLDAQQTRSRLDSINDAIGRPVTKVFLDRDDSVILDLGDLVTHQAVQRAADAGLLDSLLACVYKAGDVTFTRDEMRAEIAGDSTVDKASGGASVVTELESKVDEATQPPSERSAQQDEATQPSAEGSGQPDEATQPATEGSAEARWQPAAPPKTEEYARTTSV
jgi:uncharacterized protein YrrD